MDKSSHAYNYFKDFKNDLKMALLKASIIKFSSFGLAVFIFLLLMYPDSIIEYSQTVEKFKRQPAQKNHRFLDIEDRIRRDKENIKRLCSNYLSSTHPPIPKRPDMKTKQYHMNKAKKLGWCINAKVGPIVSNNNESKNK